MSLARFALVVAMLGALFAGARAETVDIALDDQCIQCSTTITPGEPLSLRIVLRDVSPGSGAGLAGVDFRLEGVPGNWGRTYVASPLASLATDPFGPEGATISFVPPVSQVSACFTLYECVLTPTATPSPGIHVVQHLRKCCSSDCAALPPYQPPGPLLIVHYCAITNVESEMLCLGVCASGGSVYFDGRPCRRTAVVSTLWQAVKSCYR
jgi:hypothetical protein